MHRSAAAFSPHAPPYTDSMVQWWVDRERMNRESREEGLRSLMCAGLDGDADAHRQLLVELSGHLRGYFRSRLLRFHRGAVEAEDLVQEVLMAVHTRRDTYDRSQLFTPWVHAIARYKFLDYLRRTKGRVTDVPADEAAHLTARNDFAEPPRVCRRTVSVSAFPVS